MNKKTQINRAKEVLKEALGDSSEPEPDPIGASEVFQQLTAKEAKLRRAIICALSILE